MAAPDSGCCNGLGRRPPPFCRLHRGLSPLTFCDLNGRVSFWTGRPVQMTAPESATASAPDDPALLATDGPVATITLNRPAAFNAIDLSTAKKLEQLSAQIESYDDIRVLV